LHWCPPLIYQEEIRYFVKYMYYASVIRSAVFALVLASVSSGSVRAQEMPIISAAAYAEKIYLQTDAEVYTTDQTIWFNALVVSSQGLRPSTLSGVLHVELIASDERVIQRKRIKLTAGMGSGSFQLEQSYLQGIYQIRAYTEWNKNFGADFIAQCYVRLFPTATEVDHTPVTAFQLHEKEPGHYWLHAQLMPTMIDKAHKKDLTAFLTVDQRRDTLLIKGTRSGNHLLDYPLPAGAALVTLTIETQNGTRFTRTVSVKPDGLEVRFFAESGQLVQGIRSRTGIRIRDAAGKGVAASGAVVDSRGDTVAPFRTNHLGIGSIVFAPVKGLTYHAVLDPAIAGNGRPVHYPLPAAADTGLVLAVERRDTAAHLEVRTNGLQADTLQVEVSCRGALYYQIKGVVKNGLLATDLPLAGLPEGIIAFRALDTHRHPVAMRLFFNRPYGNPLQVDISMDSPSYHKREKAQLSLRVSDNAGQPVHAALTVRVMNKDQFGRVRTGRQTILSRLLLDAELQGVDEPGYYFLPGTPYDDLDALLLTQASGYRYNTPLQETFRHANEPEPYVSGRVSGVFSKKEREDVGITLLTFGQTKNMAVQQTDSLGRFAFGLGEEYVDSLAILLQTTNKKGKNQNYTISLDERKPPEIHIDQRLLIDRVDSVVAYVAKQRQARAQQELSYKLASGEILLAEVEVVRKALSPQQQQVQDRYGEADVVIPGKAIQDKEEKWSYGLYSVLLFNFPEELRIQRVGDNGGYLRAEIVGNEPTLVVVDGIPVPGYSYSIIPDIPPSEVKSVELIKFAKNFSSLYMETYPDASPLSVPMTGSVIAIYTHAGNGVYAARKPVGLLQATVPVYSPVTAFQATSYEQPTAGDDGRPDLRTLLHWADHLDTDEQGTCSTSFYHSDAIGQTIVVVEAVADDGRIGYAELVYDVLAEND